MTHPSKAKGDRGEREVADLLRAVFPEARRRVNGEESQDDLPGRDVQGVPGYCVQVRVYAKDARISQKLEEARSSAIHGEIPVVFTRKAVGGKFESHPWLVSMRGDSFLKILRRIDALELLKQQLEAGAPPVELCVCGEPKAEHGGSPHDPNSTACRNEGCGCLEFRLYVPEERQDPEDLCDADD